MFRPDDLTGDEWDELRASLRKSHAFVPSASMHTLNDKPHKGLPPVVDGEINGSGGGIVGKVVINDPDRKMADVTGVAARQYICRVDWSSFMVSRQKDFTFPVATGPVDTCTRDDNLVTITFRGKATLSQHQAGEALTIPAGVKITEAIMRVMELRGGERRGAMNIPDHARTLTKDFTVKALDLVWGKAVELANQLDLRLFYDQAGFLVARPHPTTSSDTFHAGENGWFITEPKQEDDFTGFHNEVWFYYGDVKDPYIAEPPKDHPLSAWTLRRTPTDDIAVPCRRILVVRRKQVKLLTTAKVQANALLARELATPVKISGEIFPFPFMQTGDLYRTNGKDYTGLIEYPEWTVPLAPGATMPIGFTDVRSWGSTR